MSASFNRVVLVGNSTRDIELRYTPTGTAVTDIGLAVNERFTRNNQQVEEVNFFDVTLWGRTAEVAHQYLKKGHNVLIEGRLKQDRWEQDGQNRSRVKVVGTSMQLLNNRPAVSNQKPQQKPKTTTTPENNAPVNPGEVPF